MQNTVFTNNPFLPAEIVLAPEWWFHNEGITFDEDFFYHPTKRVEVERQMENALYQRWGRFGLGADRDKLLPIIGPVHLAAGFLVSEMLGCRVDYRQDAPPRVHCADRPDLDIDAEKAFESTAYKKFLGLVESLQAKFGYLLGDVNWGGILNIALDLRGQALFTDMYDRPDRLKRFLKHIATVIERFTQTIAKWTGSTSVSVNRTVRHLAPAVFLHSECSHTMISADHYLNFLYSFDHRWSRKYRPFGIHFCGKDPHRYAGAFAKLPHLDFLDVGWGGDVAKLRQLLPHTFLNIRLSPVELIQHSAAEIEQTIRTLVAASANPHLTGVCCINIDHNVTDDKIDAIFQTVADLRKGYPTP